MPAACHRTRMISNSGEMSCHRMRIWCSMVAILPEVNLVAAFWNPLPSGLTLMSPPAMIPPVSGRSAETGIWNTRSGISIPQSLSVVSCSENGTACWRPSPLRIRTTAVLDLCDRRSSMPTIWRVQTPSLSASVLEFRRSHCLRFFPISRTQSLSTGQLRAAMRARR